MKENSREAWLWWCCVYNRLDSTDVNGLYLNFRLPQPWLMSPSCRKVLLSVAEAQFQGETVIHSPPDVNRQASLHLLSSVLSLATGAQRPLWWCGCGCFGCSNQEFPFCALLLVPKKIDLGQNGNFKSVASLGIIRTSSNYYSTRCVSAVLVGRSEEQTGSGQSPLSFQPLYNTNWGPDPEASLLPPC